MQIKWPYQVVSVMLSVMLALAFLPVTSAYAAGTITSTTSGGLWSSGSTWVGGVVPSTGDSVIIETGATITLDGPITVDGVLTINNGATLDTNITNNYALIVNGDLTNSGTFRARGSTVTVGGIFTMAAGSFNGATSTLNLNGTVTSTGGTFTPGATVNYGAAGNQTIITATYSNLTTSGGTGTKSIAGNLTINGILTIGAGTTFTVGAFSVTQADTTIIDGTLTHSSATGTKTYTDVTINSGGIWNDNAAVIAISVNGNLQNNGTLNAGTGVHTFTGASKTFSGSNTISIPNTTITGTYTNNGTLTVGTALAGTGGLTQGTSATLNLNGTTTITTLTATANPNTVNYGGAAQTVKPTTYHHLGLSGSAAKTLTSLTTINGNLSLSGTATAITVSALTIGGNLTVASGTTFTVANAITVSGSTSVTGTLAHSVATGVKTYDGLVTINSGGIWTNAGNSAITFHHGLTNNGTTFTSGTGVYTFDTNNQTISGTSAITIANLTVNGVTLTNNSTLTASTVLSGTGELAQAVNATLNITGTAGITTLTATANPNIVNYNGTAQTVNVNAATYHHLTLSNSGIKTLPAALTTINGDLTISGTATTTTAGALTIGGNLAIGNGTTFTVAGFNITVMGTTTVTGTLIHSSATGTKIYTGLVTIVTAHVWNNSGNANITFRGGLTNNGTTFTAGTGVYTFDTNNQTIGGASAISLTNLTVTGVTLTNSGTLTVSTVLNGTGELAQGTSTTLNITGTVGITTLTGTASPNTINYNGTAQTVKGANYYHLITAGSGIKTTSGNVTVAGNLTIGTGTSLAVGSSDITVLGTTTVTGTLTHSSTTGTKIYTGLVTSTGTWSNTGNAAVTFRGGLTASGTFTAGTGVYTFDTNPQTITATIAMSIPSITVTGVVVTNNITTLTVATALSGVGGTFIQGVNTTLNLGGIVDIDTLTATASPNTVSYNTDNQTIKATTYHHLTTAGSIVTKTLGGNVTINGNLTTGATTTLDASVSNYSITLLGNWTNNGAFTPQSGTFTLQGSAAQTLSGTTVSFNNLTINNSAGVTIAVNETVNGTFTLTNGKLTTGTFSLIIGETGSVAGANTTKYVFGNLQKNFATGSPSFTFDIGDSTNYTPVTLAFASVTTAGSVTAKTTAGEHPNISTSGLDATKTVNRYWTLTSAGGLLFTTYDATFNFVAGDIDGGANTANFIAKRFISTTSWAATTDGTRTATSTQATGITVLNAFAVGEADAILPTITNITSTKADGTYTTGVLIPVTVTFSELVTVTGTPKLTLETGATDRTANYASGSGTATLTFNYTTIAGDASSDLDYVDTTSLTLSGGTINDPGANPAVLTLPTPGAAGSLGANKAIVVDTTVPTVSSVSSTIADGSYNAGSIIAVTVTFSEPVNVTGTPTLTLETGTTDRTVSYASGSGTNTLTFNYTVQAGDTSADLDYVATNSLALNGGTIKDISNNVAVLTLATPGAAGSLKANKAIVVDTTASTVTSVSSTSANGAYSVGSIIDVTVTFSEAVNVTGTPTLTLETGTTDQTVNYVSGSGTNTLTFTYTVQAGDTSADLDYVATTSLALNGGTIKDSATNNATLTLAAPGAAGSLGANKAIVIATTAPTVTSVSSTTANGSYNAGSTVAVTVTFSTLVNVTGTPTLTLETGSTDQTINYASGTGTNTLTFNYTVQAGDTSSDLDYVDATSLALNGGTIQDAATNPATLTLATPGAAGSLSANKAIVIDTTAATVTNVSATTANGSYNAAKIIAVTVTFNEAVVVTGTPTLTLETGTTDQTINYASGSGTSTLTFNYTVQAGDASADLDYAGTTSLALNGGTIKDLATNIATLTLATPGAAGSLAINKAIVIDTMTPTVASVSSTITNGTYTTGAVIPVTVTFSEPVIVTGTPKLTLETGTTDQTANYTSGSGTATLTFNYTVVAGNTSADLTYVATTSLTLNSGTIKDVATNAATLTLAAPAAVGSLGANKAIVIDTTAPDTQINSKPASFSNSTSATFTFSSADGTATFECSLNAATYVACVSPKSYTGLAQGARTFAVRAKDSVGNIDATPASYNWIVDTTAPLVSSIVLLNPNPTYRANVNFKVTFSESVTGLDTADFSLTKTGSVAFPSVASVSGSGTVYTVTVNTGSGNGTLRLDVLNNGTIKDLATNPLGSAYAAGPIYTINKVITINSLSTNDGWVLESGENTNLGGTLNATATTFNLGDDATNKQYRSFLQFNTANIPATAVITGVSLKIQKASTVGTNPFTAGLNSLIADMGSPYFGTTANLLTTDFQATATKALAVAFSSTPIAGTTWYQAVLNSTAITYINRTGTTQFRLRFATDDNNNSIADYMQFYSGEAPSAIARPQLVVTFYVP